MAECDLEGLVQHWHGLPTRPGSSSWMSVENGKLESEVGIDQPANWEPGSEIGQAVKWEAGAVSANPQTGNK